MTCFNGLRKNSLKVNDGGGFTMDNSGKNSLGKRFIDIASPR